MYNQQHRTTIRCENNWKFVLNILILTYLKAVPFATFVEWRLGWTTLFQLMYQGFRLYLYKRNEMIIFEPYIKHFWSEQFFEGAEEILAWLEGPAPNHCNQV